MQLKTYQQNVLDQLDRWLDALKEARLKRETASKALKESGLDVPEELKNYPLAAWNCLKAQNVLPTVSESRRRLRSPRLYPPHRNIRRAGPARLPESPDRGRARRF